MDRGFIAGGAFYPNFTMTDQIVEPSFAALDQVFAMLADAADRHDIVSRLRGPTAHCDYRRLP